MKKVYKIVAVVAIVAAAGFTAYNAQANKMQLSTLALANVEALASGEFDGYCHTSEDLSAICDYYHDGPICFCGF